MRCPHFPIRKHNFRGKLWNIIWRAPKRTKDTPKGYEEFGKCDPNTNTLWIHRSSDGIELLDTILDESLHACIWDLDNESVRETVESIMGLCKRMGMKVTFEPNGR